MAIASLVLSLLWLGGLGSLLAVIFGQTAAGTARREHRQASQLGSWGTALGVMGLAGAVLLWGLVIWSAMHTTPACGPSSPSWPYCQ
jgi:uncharacterized membrane protein YbhN (UPF0104 family)